MPRFRIALFLPCLIAASMAAPAFAQNKAAPAAADAASADAGAPAATWPIWVGDEYPEQFTLKNFNYGQGYYLSIPKILVSVVLLLLWIRSCDWVNQDAQHHKYPYLKWNSIVVFPFAAAFILQWFLPWYWIAGFPLLLLSYVGPLFAYVGFRNKKATDDDKVFTSVHIRRVLAEQLAKVGVKIDSKPKTGPVSPVVLNARNAKTPAEKQQREIAARATPGFQAACGILHRSFETQATGIMLDYSAEAVAIKFLVDGVWLDAEPMHRQIGDPALATMKTVCGLKPDDRRTRQHGEFTAFDEFTKHTALCKFTSQGTKTGERVLIQFEDILVHKRRIGELGMRQKMQEDLQELMNRKQGLVVIAAPPAGGLTSLSTACLAAIDRFTRSAMALEDEQNKDIQVENVPVTFYDSLAQETPMSKLPGIIRQFPDVLIVPDMVNAESAALLCDEASTEDKLVVTFCRAKEAAEALLVPAVQTKVPLKAYGKAIAGVIVQRLVRKLCDNCKEAYPPQPAILQKLGIPADKVPAFFRTPTQPRQEVCGNCSGRGYKGQIPLFELLVVDDTVRQTLLTQPKLEALRAAARKAGMKTMEEEGLLQVVKGTTSIQELQRVLREGAPAAPAAAPAAAPRPPAAKK
ncbi:MAG: Flp pilus assembly complex ATPase component TadA [Planctomycetales bacterium]|nr:Flp pilus assembly complex ATPase component TadA [Planctomycetales bacterium]MBN8625999.1 Flp pilus assembly complex ATPase component TadA [Planctomycetota bacterium]